MSAVHSPIQGLTAVHVQFKAKARLDSSPNKLARENPSSYSILDWLNPDYLAGHANLHTGRFRGGSEQANQIATSNYGQLSPIQYVVQ